MISVALNDKDGSLKVVNAEQWIVKVVDRKPAEVDKLSWAYTGSMLINGRFFAQTEGSIIALYHDPVALIDNASPGGESDKIWFVKEGAVPPVGTPVTITIKTVK